MIPTFKTSHVPARVEEADPDFFVPIDDNLCSSGSGTTKYDHEFLRTGLQESHTSLSFLDPLYAKPWRNPKIYTFFAALWLGSLHTQVKELTLEHSRSTPNSRSQHEDES